MMRSWMRGLVLTGLLLLVAAAAIRPNPEAFARSREEPTIILNIRQCPPGMTDANLDIASCPPITNDADVLITSIDGTQRDVTLAEATLDNTSFSWNVHPSDREIDDWGIKLTQSPSGTTGYLVAGSTVTTKRGHSYDFRFTTSEKEPTTTLDLVLFSPGVDGVVIPPSGQDSTNEQEKPEPTTQAAEPPQPADTVETPVPSATTPPMRTEKVDAPSAPTDSAELDTAQIVEVTADPGMLRMATTQNSMVVSTLSKGEKVSILAGPEADDGQNWYQVETKSRAVGWIEEASLDVPQSSANAEADAGQSQTSTSPQSASSESESAAPAQQQPASDYLYTSGDRAIVVDPPLTLRAGPDTNADVVDKLENDQGLEITSGPTTAAGYDWYEVVLLPNRDVTGYVASDFIEPVKFIEDDAVYVSDGVLNLRKNPGLSSGVEAKIEDGVNGVILSGPAEADGYDWYEVAFDTGSTGWAASEFISLGGTSTTESSSSPEVSPASDSIYAAGTHLAVSDPPVNVRPSPDTSGAVIEQLDAGDTVTVVGYAGTNENGDWYEVEIGNQNGYIVGAFFSQTYSAGDVLEVVDGPVYLRGSAHADAAILDGIDQGTTLTVLDEAPVEQDGYTWIKVETASGAKGYVATEFLGPVT